MLRLSLPLRQALGRLTLPVLFAASFAVVLLGRLDLRVGDRARAVLSDALAPLYALIAPPVRALRVTADGLVGLIGVDNDNARLRAENARLRHWQAVALALAAQNRALKAALHWVPSPAPEFVTARVVADAGGVYVRAMLLASGPNHFIHPGQIVLAHGALVGRIADVGARSARVLLLTDLNSRIPVLLEGGKGRAILAGTNGPRPRLIFATGAAPRPGEQVVTAGLADGIPPDLPVGTVRLTAHHVPEVVPYADLDRLETVQVVQGGLPPPAAAAP